MLSFLRISVVKGMGILDMTVMWVMQTYLTNVWKLSFVHAAGIINVWTGMANFLMIPFAFFADSFGDFSVLLFSCSVDFIGLTFLMVSTPPFNIGQCNKYEPECISRPQKILFYISLALIALGVGSRVSYTPLLREQIERLKEEVRSIVICDCDCSPVCSIGQGIGCYILVVTTIAGGLVLLLVKSWSTKFGLTAICSLVALLVFLSGWFWHPYTFNRPQGSPLTTFFRVYVAAIRKRSKKLPEDGFGFYTSDDVQPTHFLRCFNKAAIILRTLSVEEQKKNKWHLCSVREVEDTKICLKMTPLCITLILSALVRSLGNTYFLEQANQLNQQLGSLKINVLVFVLFTYGTSFISSRIYITAKRNWPSKKKYFPIYGIAFSLVTSILCCITAAKVETQRLKVISSIPDLLTDNPSKDTKVPMSMFMLVPQYLLLGVFSGISSTCYSKLFKTRYPTSMNKYIQYFTSGLTGIGTAASYLLVHIVGKVSERGGTRPNWFEHTLNQSRLDKYYWTLAVISSINLFLYIIIALNLPAEPEPKPEPSIIRRIVKLVLRECTSVSMCLEYLKCCCLECLKCCCCRKQT